MAKKKKKKSNVKKSGAGVGTKFQLGRMHSALRDVLDRLAATGLDTPAVRKLRSGVKTLMSDANCGQTMLIEL
jgi:hypothetical protein